MLILYLEMEANSKKVSSNFKMLLFLQHNIFIFFISIDIFLEKIYYVCNLKNCYLIIWKYFSVFLMGCYAVEMDCHAFCKCSQWRWEKLWLVMTVQTKCVIARIYPKQSTVEKGDTASSAVW